MGLLGGAGNNTPPPLLCVPALRHQCGRSVHGDAALPCAAAGAVPAAAGGRPPHRCCTARLQRATRAGRQGIFMENAMRNMDMSATQCSAVVLGLLFKVSECELTPFFKALN